MSGAARARVAWLGLIAPPVCAAFWPAFALARGNADEVFSLTALLAPLLAIAAAGALVAVVLRALTGAPRWRAGATAGISVGALFGYGPIVDAWTRAAGHSPPTGGPAVAWALAAAGLVLAAWRLTRRPAAAQSTALALLVGAALGGAQVTVDRARASDTAPVALERSDPLGAVRRPPSRPNVYLVVLDELARPDVFRGVVGVSVDDQVAALAARGFVVSPRASANYPMTYLSLASLFSMRYLTTGQPHTVPGALRVAPILQRRNPAVTRFRALGYAFTHVQPGRYEFFACHGIEQRCVGHAGEPPMPDEARAYLLLTPLHAVLTRVAPGLVASELTTVDDVLAALARPPVRPTFTFVHLLLPHERVYGPDCRATRESAARRDRAAYAATARCVLRQITALADTLAARDPSALVAILSDHGSDFLAPWAGPPARWPRAAVAERLSTFAAFRLPARCRPMVYDDVSPVNVMRILFACVEGTSPRLVADSAFLVSRHALDAVAVPRP